jgi:hypothetical protein
VITRVIVKIGWEVPADEETGLIAAETEG